MTQRTIKFRSRTPRFLIAFLGALLPVTAVMALALLGVYYGPTTGLSRQADDVMPGTYDWSLLHGGLTRAYRIHIPPSYSPAKPTSLILALHGGGGTGQSMERLTGLNPLSDREGFVVVYPSAVNGLWNDAVDRTRPDTRNIDDVGFISALIDYLTQRLSIDRRRVYATGFSNGGHMTNRLATEISDRLAAVGIGGATMDADYAASHTPARPVAVIYFHGTADPRRFYDGGGVSGGNTLPAPAMTQWWTRMNGCTAGPIRETLPDKTNDGTRVDREIYRPCKDGVEVVFYRIEGGGHTWPGGFQYLPESEIGKTSRDISASELIWEFFSAHPRTASRFTCNSTTGLSMPLPVCTAGDPCARPASGVGVPMITASSDAPICRTTVGARPAFNDGQPLDWTDPNGVKRYACLFRPPGTSPASPRPLIVWLHGGGTGSASDVYNATLIRAKAASYDLTGDPSRPGFILLSVQGRNLHYPTRGPRDGRHHDFYYRDLRSPSTNPDIANVDRLIDELAKDGSVDRQRIYMMGWSNGAFFGQMYAIARHVTPTPGGNRVAAVVAFTGADPFNNLDLPEQTSSCQLNSYPKSNAPIFLVSRACDLIACNQAQAQGFAAQGGLTEPGHIVEPWVADLAAKVGNPNVSWRIVAGNGAQVNSCTPPGSCSYQAGVINHIRWPDGVADGSGIDHEPAMLDFLRSRPITSSASNVSAASYGSAQLAAESIVAAFGAKLATMSVSALNTPLPTSLAGTTVKARDSAGTERLAPLFFVSPAQINYQMPPGTVNGAATVTITSGDGTVSAGTVQIASIAPGLFTADASGRGLAAATVLRVRADGSQSFEPVAQFDPAQNKFVAAPINLGSETDQVFLILFGTGLRSRSALSAVTAKIGGADAQVTFAGAQSGFVGLDQVNVRLARSLAGRGEVDVALAVDGMAANTVKVSIGGQPAASLNRAGERRH